MPKPHLLGRGHFERALQKAQLKTNKLLILQCPRSPRNPRSAESKHKLAQNRRTTTTPGSQNFPIGDHSPAILAIDRITIPSTVILSAAKNLRLSLGVRPAITSELPTTRDPLLFDHDRPHLQSQRHLADRTGSSAAGSQIGMDCAEMVMMFDSDLTLG